MLQGLWPSHGQNALWLPIHRRHLVDSQVLETRIVAAVESLLKDSYIDMYQCMHFLDNWEEDKSGETDWEDIFAVEKYEPLPDVRTHRGWLQSVMEGGCQLWQMVDYR